MVSVKYRLGSLAWGRWAAIWPSRPQTGAYTWPGTRSTGIPRWKSRASTQWTAIRAGGVLTPPRIIYVSVPAGKIVDEVPGELTPHLDKGDGVELLLHSDFDLEKVFENWSHGSVIRGWLVELIAKGLKEKTLTVSPPTLKIRARSTGWSRTRSTGKSPYRPFRWRSRCYFSPAAVAKTAAGRSRC